MSQPATAGTYLLHRNSIVNDVLIRADIERSVTDSRPAQVTYRDMKAKKDVVLTVEAPTLSHDVVRYLERRRFDAARVWSRAASRQDVYAQWLVEWRSKRCLYLGMPNRSAMTLLTGLRKRIGISYRMGKDGGIVRENTVSRLAEADLMRVKDCVPTRLRSGFMTSPSGYRLLKMWAEDRPAFRPFFEAYCPKDWEENYLADQVLDTMTNRVKQEAWE